MQNTDTEKQLELARQAARGDAAARVEINELVQPVIEFQTSRFCKRFCRENRFRYQCTLLTPWGNADKTASLCEWGNASYGWMLGDLTSSHRLKTYQGRSGSSLYNYLYQIANSLPFYERWKDWRFGRKVYVPAYIKEMGPLAAKVFLALRSQHAIANIAQSLAQDIDTIENISQQIVILLTEKKRLHLLTPPENISLTQTGTDSEQHEHGAQMDLPSYDEAIESKEEKQQVSKAWKGLNAVEQFVLEALVIEEQDASTVLDALKTLGIGIKDGVAADQTNRQQLYYFRRKTLAKLSQLIKQNEKNSNDH